MVSIPSATDLHSVTEILRRQNIGSLPEVWLRNENIALRICCSILGEVLITEPCCKTLTRPSQGWATKMEEASLQDVLVRRTASQGGGTSPFYLLEIWSLEQRFLSLLRCNDEAGSLSQSYK